MGETMVRERPILFSGEMVRALLDGRKTQTRRVVTPQPTPGRPPMISWRGKAWDGAQYSTVPAVYGGPGDLVWVRESVWARGQSFMYDATATDSDRDLLRAGGWRLRPSIHMPRAASRLTLEITDARVERVQEITEADALAEGCPPKEPGSLVSWKPLGWFRVVWDRLNAARGYGWDANPWVWALTFRRVDAA